MKKLLSYILFICLATSLMAQEQPTKKQQADQLFERYEYYKSLNLYLDLASKNNPDLGILERVAECYRLTNNYASAEEWYARVADDERASPQCIYAYAEVLLRNQKFDQARATYKVYYDKVGKAAEYAAKLATIDSAVRWMALTPRYNVQNADKFNTSSSDWGLAYYGKTGFVFTSDRNMDNQDKRTGEGYYRLYQSIDGNIGELPMNTKGNPLFNTDYHTGPMAINASGDTAYITITTRSPKRKIVIDKNYNTKQRLYTRWLQLIIATKTKGEWGNFKNFPYNNIEQYSVGHAALSKDGNMLYFTSDMPGGIGETDIWYCQKQADGTWGKPLNCGPIINTAQEEAFPTISGDTLYYSSKGLPGMGGFDIFKTVGQKDSWSKPVNMQYPINSTSDDFCLITHDGISGYLSSNREVGKGSDDIYSFTNHEPHVPFRVPLGSDNAGRLPAKQFKPPFEVGKSYVFNNIYYDLDKSNIRPDAAIELDKLYVILRDNPTLKIELSSHTDSRASHNYNMALSQRRAASAVAYLVSKGIDRSRMTAKGYGDTQLLNKCAKGVPCTEAEHQLNRRTEVKVVGY
ncbi:OmpA family protein [uncultured Mucilaginibacter sp.]|uniref:OmpA family protein n=1 Tax=uncultured Mucilaginibacter sp. TaxID=797541 RepID=UPI0025D6C9C7|nr:OmpA family protein [uncultured Mucilaginibacter sp.]